MKFRLSFLLDVRKAYRVPLTTTAFLLSWLLISMGTISYAGEFVPNSGTAKPPVNPDSTQPKPQTVKPPTMTPPTIDSAAWNRKRVKTRQTELPLKDSSVLIPKTYTFFQIDTTNRIPMFTNTALLSTDERSFSDGWRRLPGVYPLHHGFYGQPAFAVAPHDPPAMRTEIFGRDNADPITGYAPEDLLPVRGVASVSGGPFGEDGNVIRIDPLLPTPRRAMMMVDYRDGFYALGRADFRFFQPLTPVDHWGFSTTVSQANGRYTGAALDATTLLAHYRHVPLGKPAFAVFGRQTTDNYGIGYRAENARTIKRFDVDMILAKSLPGEVFIDSLVRDSLLRFAPSSILPFSHWQLQGYWTRNQTRILSYPLNEGRRLGFIGTVASDWEGISLETAMRIEEQRANLDQELIPVQKQIEGKVSLKLKTLLPTRLTFLAIGSNHFATEPQGKFAIDLPFHSLPYTTLWFARTTRYPTIEERFVNDSLAQYIRSYDPIIHSTTTTAMYRGNRSLQPVRAWRGGLQLSQAFSNQTKINLYLTSVTETNPIETTIQPDPFYGSVFTPRNGNELSYTMAGFSFYSRPLGWGLIDATGTVAKYENDQPYYVPTEWGQCDIGTIGSYKRDALQWSAITRFRFIGERDWITPEGTLTKHARVPVDLLLSVQVYSLRINWGVTNFFDQEYEELPGFLAMHREEVWGIRWTLWD